MDSTYDKLTAQQVLQGRTPELDVFASSITSTMSSSVSSHFLCPGRDLQVHDRKENLNVALNLTCI